MDKPGNLFHRIRIRDAISKRTGKCGNFSQVRDPKVIMLWESFHKSQLKNNVSFSPKFAYTSSTKRAEGFLWAVGKYANFWFPTAL